MFGKTSFNKTRFNRAGEVLHMYCRLKSSYSMEASSLHALVSMDGPTFYAEYRTESEGLYFMVPIAATEISGEYEFEPEILKAHTPLAETKMESEYELYAASLRNDVSEEISLEGVNLAPGQTLMIDTDTLEVFIDGVSNVDVWVSGSTFFQLQHGNNSLKFYDNASQRTLNVTILWSDRYL